MKIIDNFESEYYIYEGYNPCEIFAGRELKDFIYKSTSVILSETEGGVPKAEKNKKIISVGDTIPCGLSRKYAELKTHIKDDGYAMFAENGNLFITGNTPKGTLNGVYGFLRKFIGVKFLSESETLVPDVSVLEIDDNLEIVDNPSFSPRVFFMGVNVRTPLLVARNRIQTPYCYSGNVEYFGGSFEEFGLRDVHTMMELVPREEFMEIHPEWFSDLNMKYPWLCLTNGITADGKVDFSDKESVALVVLERLKQVIIENPKAKYFMFGQSDNDAWCKCEKCLESYKRFNKSFWWENEGVMATLVVFVNAIAEEIEKWAKKEFPEREIYIVTLSYRGTLHPPVYKDEKGEFKPVSPLVVPRKNVIIMYAASGCCQTHELDYKDCYKARWTYNDLSGWKALNANLMVYDYSCVFNNVLWYYPMLKTLKSTLKKYKEFGVKGIYRQALHIEGRNFEAVLQEYLFSEMFWNSDADVDRLFYDFTEDYFKSEAAFFVRKYFELMEKTVYGAKKEIFDDIHASMYIEEGNYLFSKELFTEQVLRDGIKIINDGFFAVENSDKSAREKNEIKIKLCSVIIQPEMMLLALYGNSVEDAEKLKQDFGYHAKKAGVIYIAESCISCAGGANAENTEDYFFKG